MKHTVKHFHAQFKNDADCLAYIMQLRHPKGSQCPVCGRKESYYPLTTRRVYSCACGHQICPTAGTIFHKSPTPLKSWFFAMYLIGVAKNGISAKELERQLGVTYKTAWRMAQQIRKLMEDKNSPLAGIVEADETYIGGKRPGKRGRGASGKTPVIGLLQRGGKVVAKIAKNVRKVTLVPHIQANVAQGSTVVTDELPSYNSLMAEGFEHEAVNHSSGIYVRGLAHTNGIEGFWSQLKRSIHGTFHQVSGKYLQRYVNEFAFRYNRRKSPEPMFYHLLPQVADMHA